MRDGLYLYWRYVRLSLRAQCEYRASLAMTTIGHLLLCSFEILGIWALFARFGALGSWKFEEVGLLYGLVNVAFALAEGFGRGLDTFAGLVRSGDFDRLLLRPRGTVFQVAAREVQAMRAGRLLQGLAVLLWAAARVQVDWTWAHVALVVWAVLGGAAVFLGLLILQATLCFWTIEALEIMNITTYGGTEAGQFPLTIYQEWFQKFLVFVVPLACATYFPVLALLGRPDVVLGSPAWFHWCAPGLGLVFLGVSFQVWNFGVRRYGSTGS